MGCGSSARPHPEDEALATDESVLAPAMTEPRSVIIWGAKDLHDADCMGEGSDPYCIVRVGPSGKTWEEKARGSGRRSEVVSDVDSPRWDMGFGCDIHGMVKPEVHIRVYDKDWATEDDFLGEARVEFRVLEAAQDPMDLPLSGGHGTVVVSGGPLGLLDENNIKPSAFYEAMAPIGEMKPVQVEAITGDGPLLVGKEPLPVCLRGIFWLTDQGSSSALASFAGPNNDGGGCSTGHVHGNKYKVRVFGDRVWAMATGPATLSNMSLDLIDLVYHFVFDNGAKPTKCQIYPEVRELGITLTAEWLLDFEAHLVAEDKEFAGSVVWRRPSWMLGEEIKSAEYALVQVIDAEGQRIEPAWSKFVQYQGSEDAGGSPGTVWFHEARADDAAGIPAATDPQEGLKEPEAAQEFVADQPAPSE